MTHQNDHAKKFTEFISKELNPSQQKAVLKKDGVFVVCAGAGSGKTRVITARITNLILSENVPSSAIIALTFTNKAAHEMKDRVRSFLPKDFAAPYVGTFHAYCVRLLKSYQHLLPHQQFSILDSDDQKTLIQKIITANGLQKKITAKSVTYAISNLKNASLNGTVNPALIGDQLTREIFVLYEQEKQRAHCFDFDDLLLETLLLFKKNPGLVQHYQATIRHVLVDEYQDTNHVQHALLKAMTCSTSGFALDSLCVVGDEDQSIYSWRGATVHNILNFKDDFADTSHIAIEQNYRSAQPILEAANGVIRHNKTRNPKNLWSTRPGTDRIRVVQTASEYQEADFIATIARETFKRNKHASCAVLYRGHHQSRAIEEILIRQSIPYTIIGGIQFYERQEIKDLLAYLRLVVNPFDRVSFMRVFNTPSRGLGDKFEELFFETWQLEPFLSFDAVANHIINQGLVVGIKLTKLKEFLELFTNVTANDKASAVLAAMIKNSHYFEYLQHAFEAPEALAKSENVKELMSAIHAMEEQGLTTLRDFLDEVALLQDHSRKTTKEDGSYLYLMSLHAAKGLEFDTVILAGLEDGMFPSSRSIFDAESLEEERRLMYVGITRAREHLLITQACYRHVYGTLTAQQPSRFLREIPQHVARFDDAGRWRMPDIQVYIASWFAGIAAPNKSVAEPKIQASTTFDWDKDPFTKSAAKPITKTPVAATKPLTTSRWKKFQPVQHKSFGTGIIQEIEEKEAGTKIYLTVKFSEGVKKIDSKFVELV